MDRKNRSAPIIFIALCLAACADQFPRSISSAQATVADGDTATGKAGLRYRPRQEFLAGIDVDRKALGSVRTIALLQVPDSPGYGKASNVVSEFSSGEATRQFLKYYLEQNGYPVIDYPVERRLKYQLLADYRELDRGRADAYLDVVPVRVDFRKRGPVHSPDSEVDLRVGVVARLISAYTGEIIFQESFQYGPDFDTDAPGSRIAAPPDHRFPGYHFMRARPSLTIERVTYGIEVVAWHIASALADGQAVDPMPMPVVGVGSDGDAEPVPGLADSVRNAAAIGDREPRLWSIALAMAGGSEQRAMQVYVELRIRQLRFEKREADREANLAVSANLDGTWISTITSDHAWYLNKKFQRLIFTIEQQGNRIRATNHAGKAVIFGTRNGDRIDFRVLPGAATGFNAVDGQWTIRADGNTLEGSWEAPAHNAGGIWNLRRFGNRGLEFYTVETGPDLPFYIDDSEALLDIVFRPPRNRNIVFYIHGRGDDFRKNFDPGELPFVEQQTNTRFVVLRWLSWGGSRVRPIDHASSAAQGLSSFLRAFDDYKSSHPERLRNIGVTLMAHSMGNIPLMVFAQEHHEDGSLQRNLLDAVIISSADLPLRKHAEWVEKIDFTGRVYIVQHRNDMVLRLSKWFFDDRPDWQGPKLGNGPAGGELAPARPAANALYLDVTDLTLPLSHRHFDMGSYSTADRINRLYRRLLNGQAVRIPDPDIGLFEDPDSRRRLVLRNRDPDAEVNRLENSMR